MRPPTTPGRQAPHHLNPELKKPLQYPVIDHALVRELQWKWKTNLKYLILSIATARTSVKDLFVVTSQIMQANPEWSDRKKAI